MCDLRIVPCDACGTEGRIYQRHQWLCRHTGYHDDDVDTGECPWCEGTGGEIVKVYPITLADLITDDSFHASHDMGQR